MLVILYQILVLILVRIYSEHLFAIYVMIISLEQLFVNIFFEQLFANRTQVWYSVHRNRIYGGIFMSYGKITQKQTEILEYIKQEILKKGYPPTVRDICNAVNLKSTSSVHAHLETLEKNGYIRRDPTKPRAIEIIDDSFNLSRREFVNVPMVGRVAAGEPILATENIDNYFPIPSEFVPNNEVFMLEIKGESMINAGIFDGDWIVVEKRDSARNGEIVVALVDDSATVKTFYKEDGHIRLQPENDNLAPIIVPDCKILGKVISLYRRFV